jgi:uncharacterized phage protein gp47/JayE
MYSLSLESADVPLGTRFATPDGEGVIYITEARLEAGIYSLRCETTGSVGNDYVGDVLPLYAGNNLGRAEITGTLTPARDEEADDDYRARVAQRVASRAFGGNIADYKRFVTEIEGVGGVKVFPVWHGGGSVKIAVVDSAFNNVSPEFLTEVKNAVDPEEDEGTGAGTAPIGHVVTVSTPQRVVIDVKAVVTLDNRTVGQVLAEAVTGLGEYFATIRRTWSETNEVNIYAARVAAELFKIPRVVNVTGVTLNDVSGDVLLLNSAIIQQIPYLGDVTLYEGGE